MDTDFQQLREEGKLERWPVDNGYKWVITDAGRAAAK